MSGRGQCADCDPSSASTASVSSDLHKYHVACSCGNGGQPTGAGQYAECAPTGPEDMAPQKVERPPALPPRPPPRPRTNGNPQRNGESATSTSNSPPGSRKYVWWCLAMGTVCCLLGGLLFAAAFVLRALTKSLHLLETIPTPIPATMLVLTGLCVMSLARRKNRYSYLIKVVGACCLVCALTCVLVTITTTVIHMNRLQTLRQCFYTDETRTCDCSSTIIDGQNNPENEGFRCVFEEVANCDAVHGSLYLCLSAIFGLSISGVLICICSAMLAYQLLSHERKKMYWEQLELRCRSLYRPANGGQASRTQMPPSQVCDECCTRCRAAAVANWDLQQRFWASGRVGNLYSPNPGTGRRVSPWSWFPWSRNANQRVGGTSSGDSAYGFGNTPSGYWQLGPPPPYTPHHRYHHHHSTGLNSSHHHLPHSHSPIHMPHGCTMMNQPGRSVYPSSLTPHGSISDLESQHMNSHTLHHHHHQDSLRMGMAVCHQNNQMHSSVRVLQCHDSNMILPLSPGHFVPINDNEGQSDESIVHRAECHHQTNSNAEDFTETNEDVHISQHTCQKHKQHLEEDAEPVNAQGEENLAFQCEKQISLRQLRSGESELYFADVSSCCNVSLKAVEYCAGLVGTIENQPDTSSGDSDAGPCPVFKGRPPRPRTGHTGHPNPQNSSSPRMNNSLWKKQTSPSVHGSSPNRVKKKSLVITPDKSSSAALPNRASPSANSSNLKCKSNTHFQDQPVCFNCSDNPTKGGKRFTNEEKAFQQDENMLGVVLSNMNCSDNSIGNTSLEGSMRSSVRLNPSHSRMLHQKMPSNDLNDVGLPPINQMRKTIDESLIIINNDLSLSHVKNRSIDESLCSDHSVEVIPSSKYRSSDEYNLRNNMTPTRLHESLTLNESQSTRRSEDSPSCSMVNKTMEESNRDDNPKMSNKRKPLDESRMSSDSNSSSPFRRMCLEDSPLSEEAANNSQNMLVTPLRRKNMDNSQLEHGARRTICEDGVMKKDLNGSMRRMSLEDTLNNTPTSSFISMKRKGIDEASIRDLNNMRMNVLEEFNRCDDADMKRKCIDDAMLLLNEANSLSVSASRRMALDDSLMNDQHDKNIAKLNFVHMMQHNARYSNNYPNADDVLNEPSLAAESEGSRRGIVGGVCIAPDLRYEPVLGFKNEVCDNAGAANHGVPMHMRCYSDSNTMDSGWQSGSEKHATD